MKRLLWLGLLTFLFFICTGCGDTFRPIIIPNTPQFPDPRASHSVVSINDSGTDPACSFPPQCPDGSLISIEVTGDSVMGEAATGVHPVYAILQSASQLLVVNRSTAGQNADSLTKVTFVSGTPQITGSSTISLPPNSAPSFVASTETATAYVTLPNYFPDPAGHPGIAGVGVVNTNGGMVASILAGTHPDTLAETRDGKKLFIANRGGVGDSPSVIGVNTVDRSFRNPTPIILGAAPVWLAARTDSQRLYALEADGTLATLDVSSTSGTDSVIDTRVVAPGAKLMTYDTVNERLYIPFNNQVAIVSVAQDPPQLLGSPITLPNIPGDSNPAVAIGAAALPDGSRAYLAATSSAPLNSNVSISSIQGDGTTATYTYSLASGHDLTPNIVVNVSGTGIAGFDGAFVITAVSSGTFQVANTTQQSATAVTATATSTANYFPQITVLLTQANTIKTTIPLPGFPSFDHWCSQTRFRYSVAAGGDSSRAYLASCDGGIIDAIRTSDETFYVRIQAPANSLRPIQPPFTDLPPQNSVFVVAGP
jgi:hypothetical protein